MTCWCGAEARLGLGIDPELAEANDERRQELADEQVKQWEQAEARERHERNEAAFRDLVNEHAERARGRAGDAGEG